MGPPSERPKWTKPAPASRSADYLLEPVPVPDVVESDSDTAWGLWQDLAQSPDTPHQREAADTSFDATVRGELTGLDDDHPASREP